MKAVVMEILSDGDTRNFDAPSQVQAVRFLSGDALTDSGYFADLSRRAFAGGEGEKDVESIFQLPALAWATGIVDMFQALMNRVARCFDASSQPNRIGFGKSRTV